MVLLPDEDPAEFQQRMTGLFKSLKPRDELEILHAERATYLSWQLERVERAEAGRLYLRANTHRAEEENRVGQEVTSLVQKLLKTPGGRPVALPCTPRTAEEEADREAGAGTFDPRNDPSLLVLQCEETALGCRKLLELWGELRVPRETTRMLAGPGALPRFPAPRHSSDDCLYDYRSGVGHAGVPGARSGCRQPGRGSLA